MTTRILPRDEWPKLAGTEAETVWPHFGDSTRVVVVEADGQIVGCHVLVPVLHVECLWVHPDHRRKAGVARRLWTAVQREAREFFGARWVQTGAASDEVRQLLAHVGGVKVECDHYMVPVGGA